MEYHTACSLGECENMYRHIFHISSLASVAQLVEHPTDTRAVVGSTPTACTKMTQQILTAFVLGLVGGIIPGPVLAATFTEILQSGFSKSLRIVFWAMLTEAIIALACLIVFSSVGFPQSFFYALSFVGAGILIWIAAQLWKIRSLDLGERIHFGIEKIAAMILANGVLWTFWITVGIPKAIALGEQIRHGQFFFLLVVEIGWLISTVGVAFVFSRFRRILSNPRVVPSMFKIFSVIFLYFALSMLYTSAVFFLK
jgi:threonine/homoserine/homoserine lactone efflux protein